MKSLRIALMLNSQCNLDLQHLFASPQFTIEGSLSHPERLGHVRAYDIIIVDTRCEENEMLQKIKALRHDSSRAKMIAITNIPCADYAQELIKMGVTGILLHNELENGLEHFVHAICSGRIVVSPGILKELVAHTANAANDQTNT